MRTKNASLMGHKSLDLGDFAGLMLDMFWKKDEKNTYEIPKFPVMLSLNMASVSSASLIAAQQIMHWFTLALAFDFTFQQSTNFNHIVIVSMCCGCRYC
jgi:hypothetical protein